MLFKRLHPAALLVLGVMFLLAMSSARGAIIPIANNSFESPPVGNASYIHSIQDWTQSGSSSGTWDPSFLNFDESTLDGSQEAFSAGDRIAQQLTTGVVLGETYHLSALFATVYTPGFEQGSTLELWSGGTVASGDVTGGFLLGSLVVNSSALVHGKFIPFQSDITAPLVGPTAGDLLAIRWVSNGNESEIDDVRLSTEAASVPEPASLAIWGLVGIGYAFGQRRRRSLC